MRLSPARAALALAAYIANLRQDSYLFEAPPPSAIPVSTNAPGTNAAPANATNAPAK